MKTYKEYYKEFYNSNNLLLTFVLYDKPENKIVFTKFLKYLTWNIIIFLKKMNIKDRFELPPSFKLVDKELDKSKPYLQLRADLRFSPIDKNSLLIMKALVSFYNTDAVNLLPITGQLFSVIAKFEKYF